MNWRSIFGFILILPSIVFCALLLKYELDPESDWSYKYLSESEKTRRENIEDMAYNSYLPIYFGLMTLCGAYLLKGKSKESN